MRMSSSTLTLPQAPAWPLLLVWATAPALHWYTHTTKHHFPFRFSYLPSLHIIVDFPPHLAWKHKGGLCSPFAHFLTALSLPGSIIRSFPFTNLHSQTTLLSKCKVFLVDAKNVQIWGVAILETHMSGGKKLNWILIYYLLVVTLAKLLSLFEL